MADNNDFRISSFGTDKRKSIQTLKSTLNFLEDKINSAKEELQLPLSSMNKKNQMLLNIDEK